MNKSFLILTVLLLCSCSNEPTPAQRVAAAYAERNAAYDRLLARIKTLPPEQQIEEYDRLEKWLAEERRERAQEDLTASIDNLADAVRGY